jgi:hypothetical protein
MIQVENFGLSAKILKVGRFFLVVKLEVIDKGTVY